jgi:tetratricopeptide (TPR) repeat protein
MRGTKIWQALGVLLVTGSLALGSDISVTVSQAQQALDRQQYSSAIALLEKALPESKGDERVIRLLRAAYRGEIPRLLQAGDRNAAQRYAERLRIIEDDKKGSGPEDKTGSQVGTSVPRRAEVQSSGTGEKRASEFRAQGSETAARPEGVKVIVPDTTQGAEPSNGATEQQSAWRPAKGPSLRGAAGRAPESAAGDSNQASAATAQVVGAQAVNPSPGPTAARVQPNSSASSDTLAEAKRLVRKADALFVARRFAEAGELYDRANRAAPESLEAARDRWVYCRLARTVEQINAVPSSSNRWSAIKSELQSILEAVPNNAFAQSLIAMADRRGAPASVSGAGREAIVRASEPDRADVKETNLLADLAGRIGLGASNSRQHSLGRRFRSGNWQVLETSNFRVHSTDDQLAGQVADIAESTRLELYKTWYGKLPDSNWNPKCDVYVHDSADQYARITRQGPGSPGHSQTSAERGRVSSRRIDLRRDGTDLVHAILPHEITHVVLADRFTTRPMPRWADEGVAVLTEPADKKHAHLKNLGEFLNRGRVFSARQLMTMNDYPNGSQWPMFYAESVSLVEFLVARSGPSKFIEFMEGALKNGYETELKRVYGFASFEELEVAWSRGRVNQVAAATDGVASR